MRYVLITSLMLVLVQGNRLTPRKTTDKFYVGAVVEYANIFDIFKFPEYNIQQNINEYAKYIRLAKEQAADIIVFPEYGLTSTFITQNRQAAILYASEIPDGKEKINPCEDHKNNEIPAWSEILTQISCEAQKNKLYVVLNLAERVKIEDDWTLYNTNIVFDRNGILISRYRKYNLYNEPAFNVTDQPELKTFTTDFGVTFATITCFDILYADPTLSVIRNKGVTDLLFPTAWRSKMPFLTAVQTQAGFVKAYGVNLLASNYDNPKNYGGGSGIYSPISGILNYTIPIVKESQLLVAKVPKLQVNKNKYKKYYSSYEKKNNNFQINNLYLETLTERWDGFTNEILESNINNHDICNGKLCCSFTINSAKGKSDYIYRLVVTDSYRGSGIGRHHVQMCGVVACSNESLDSCGKRLKITSNPKLFVDVTITGNFSTDSLFVQFPSVVNYDLSTLPFDSYSYSVLKSNYSGNTLGNTIKVKIAHPVDQILGISIYGRMKA